MIIQLVIVVGMYGLIAYMLWRVGNYIKRLIDAIWETNRAVVLTEPGRVRREPAAPGTLTKELSNGDSP